MNVRLALLRVHLPSTLRRRILRQLIAAIARAFERTPPSTRGRSPRELTAIAVERSSAWAGDVVRAGGGLEDVRDRLFAEGLALGRAARRRLRIRGDEQGLAAARVLYRAIGIDLRPLDGAVVVPRCAFARAYGPEACRLLSAMDSGLIAGLTGAAGLRFTARLTEGAPACRADLLGAGEAA